MSEADIFKNIKVPFGDDAEFPFKSLQSAGMGSKSLVLPALSSTYKHRSQPSRIWRDSPDFDIQVRFFPLFDCARAVVGRVS